MPSLFAVLALALSILWGSALARAEEPPRLEFRHVRSFGKLRPRTPGVTNYPSGVSVDLERGRVFVMDLLFNRIQVFDLDGKVLAHWPCRQGLGLTVDPRDGSVWVAMWRNHEVRHYAADGTLLKTIGTGRPGTGQGEFNAPHDVAVDPRNGDIYVIDTYNKRVQVFDEDGNFLRGWDGPFDQPFGIAVHPEGRFLVVANTRSAELLKFSLDGELLDRWHRFGSGPGDFRWPRDVTIDAKGRIYVADSDNERVQVLDSEGRFLAFVVGPNDREHGSFHPRSLSVDPTGTELWVAAAYANRVDRFRKREYVGSIGVRSREGPLFNTAKDVAVDPRTGRVYVSDWMDHRIRVFERDGTFVQSFDGWIPEETTLDGRPLGPDFEADPTTCMWISKEDQFFPGPLAIDPEGGVWTTRGSMHYDDDPRAQADWLVRRFDPDGRFLSGFAHPTFPRNARMRGVAVDATRVWVSNTQARIVLAFRWDGTPLWETDGGAEGPFQAPAGIEYDPATNALYVADAGRERIFVLDADTGEVRFAFGEPGEGSGQLRMGEFSGLAVDPRGYVFVADDGNDRVDVFDRSGRFLASWGESGFGGTGRYHGLTGVAVHDGELYVLDSAGGEVEVYDISSWPTLEDAAPAAASGDAGAAAARVRALREERERLRRRLDEIERELRELEAAGEAQ